MKGLEKIPSQRQLQVAYSKLQMKQTASETQLAKWSQWARLDARLAELLVLYFARSWQYVLPIVLNHELQKQPWPAAMGVVLDQCANDFEGHSKKHFKLWSKVVMHQISPAPYEQFFIGSSAFGKGRMLQEALFPTKSYLRWGYLGKDILWNKYPERPKSTEASVQARQNVIDDLIQTKRMFSIHDYIEKLGGAIHPRQAQRDLQDHPKIKRVGNTSASYYVVRESYQ